MLSRSLSWVFCCLGKIIQTAWGVEGLINLTVCSSSSRKVRTGTRDRYMVVEIQQWRWRKTAYWIALCDLLSLFSYTMQDDIPRSGTTSNGIGLSTSIMNQENSPTMPHRLFQRPIWREHFLNWDSFFLKWLYLVSSCHQNSQQNTLHLLSILISWYPCEAYGKE